MTTTTIDLNKDLKNKKITLKKGSTDSIVFKNDIAGQIKITESGNDIVFKVYEAVGTKNTYTKVVDSYVAKDDDKYQKTTTKYVYDGNAWKKSGKESVSIVNNLPNALASKGKSCWCTYSMSSTGGSVSTLQSYYATDSADEKDDDYNARIIAKFGSGDKSLTNKVIATIKIVDGNKASTFGYTSVKNGFDENILNNVFAPVRKGNKYTGNFLNEEVTLTSANETVNLKTGDDTVNMDFDNGLTSVGNDKITLNKNENLYLNLLNNVSEDGNISIKTSFSKKGNDLVVKYTKVDASSSDPIVESMGKTTIKNYFKIAKDNVFLYDESEDMTYSMKDALTYADGLGFLGDINSDKKQKIKGCFLDQVITTGSGNDEIKAVDGNNTIYAGKGDDKIYSGKDADNIYIYEGDASGKGDRIYNALEVDRLYIGDDEGNIDSAEYMSNNYTFEKKGNSVAITRGADTITLVDYFKKDKNRDMLFVNDTDDFSNITFEQKGRGTLYGTKYNDNIVTTGKATINTGAGNDKLTLKMKTNDTINITGAGEKEISVDTAHTGSIKFNKTINYKNTDATLKLSFENFSDDDEKRIYIRKGNDLVIGVGDYEIKNGEIEYENNPDLRYTVKDYFKKDLESKISIIETEGGEPKTVSLSDDIASSAIIYKCSLFSKGDYTDTKYNDIFLGGLRDDKYNISKGGKDVIFDSRGNEKYTVDISKSSLTLYDTSGGKDSLTVKNANNYGLYFKVEASANRVSNLGSTLQIFDQDGITDQNGNITGGVSIEKYMSYDSDRGVKKGKGCIETIKVGSTNLNIDIESIASSVASWMSDKGYTSSDYVLANADADTIKEMIAVFNGQ